MYIVAVLSTINKGLSIYLSIFNADKCNVLHFGNEKNGKEYCMGNKSLKCVSTERDLGVIITEDLKVASNCQAAYMAKPAEHWER